MMDGITCPYCGESFSSRSSVRRHIKRGVCVGLSSTDDLDEAAKQAELDESCPSIDDQLEYGFHLMRMSEEED